MNVSLVNVALSNTVTTPVSVALLFSYRLLDEVNVVPSCVWITPLTPMSLASFST